MMEMDLINLLDDLVDDEFRNFKWFLKTEKLDNIEPIKAHKLSKADRPDTVDLILQKYQPDGAVKVMMSVLKKINRNDLVTKLPNISSGAEGGESSGGDREEQKSTTSEQPAGPGPAETQSVEKLTFFRTRLIDGVNEPNLCKLLDKLLQERIINDDEVEFVRSQRNRADRVRELIDMMRKKGPKASSALIAALCEVDQCLSEELK